MSAIRWLRLLYLSRFSKPAGDRSLYRACLRQPPQSLVEIGLSSLPRTQRLLDLMREARPADELRYAAVDPFEMRGPHQTALALKQAHAVLKPRCGRLQLVPGDPYTGLARAANTLRGTDWLIIAADADAESLSRAWPFIPRMLHESSQVFVESAATTNAPGRFDELSREQIEALAAQQAKSARRAA